MVNCVEGSPEKKEKRKKKRKKKKKKKKKERKKDPKVTKKEQIQYRETRKRVMAGDKAMMGRGGQWKAGFWVTCEWISERKKEKENEIFEF